MKHDPIPTANAAAITIALVYVVCALAVVLFPSLAMSTAQSWFHGLDLSKIATFNVTPTSFIQGLITSTVGAWVVGYFFAKTYNYFARK